MKATVRFVFLLTVFSVSAWLSVSVYGQPFLSGPDQDKGSRIDKTEPNKIISDKHLTILGLTVMKNSLTNLQAKLGKAIVTPSTEAMYPDTTCYKSNNPTDSTVLIFEIKRVAGDRITGFELLSSEIIPNKEQCSKTDMISKNISTMTGLKLGMKESELVSIMGPPTLKKGSTYNYFYETDQKSESSEDFMNVLTYLKVLFVNSKAVKITLGETITSD